ncbi:protein of unassigned function [Methylobacterium oryzae CBMB20]|nr:protein of unassigned function [Methylobacterium oryzae CBMB20]
MVETAIAAHQLLALHGTSTMQLLSRLLLMEIGTEIAARRDAEAAANDNPDVPEA